MKSNLLILSLFLINSIYILGQKPIPIDHLENNNNKYYYNGKLFSGVAYAFFPENRRYCRYCSNGDDKSIQQVEYLIEFKDGFKSGRFAQYSHCLICSSERYKDSTQLNYLETSLNKLEIRLINLQRDSVNISSKLNFVLEEIGGPDKLMKYQSKYRHYNLRGKKLERLQSYLELQSSLDSITINCNQIGREINEVNNQILKENKKEERFEIEVLEEYEIINDVKNGYYKSRFYVLTNENNIFGDATGDGMIEGFYYDNKKNGIWKNNYNPATKESYLNDFLHGNKLVYAFNGQILEDANYLYGELSGTFKKYDVNGVLLLSANYLDGKLNGIYKEYDANGILLTDACYKDGELEGNYTKRNSQDIIIQEAFYSNGKKNGMEKSYFDNGKLEQEVSFVNNKEHGVVKVYYENGKLHMKGTLDSTSKAILGDHHLIGELLVYRENGDIEKRLICSKEGSIEDLSPDKVKAEKELLTSTHSCTWCGKKFSGNGYSLKFYIGCSKLDSDDVKSYHSMGLLTNWGAGWFCSLKCCNEKHK